MKFDLRLLLALAIALLIFIPGAYGISFGGGISTSTSGYSQGNTVVAGQSLNSIFGSSGSTVDKNYYVKDLDSKYAEIKLHYEGGTVTGYSNVLSPRSGYVFSKPAQVSAQQKFTAVNAKLVRAQEKASNNAGDVATTSIEVSQGTIKNYVGTSIAKATDASATQTIGEAYGGSVHLKEDATYSSQGSHVDTTITQVNSFGANFKGSTESRAGSVTSALLNGHLSGALVSTGTANSLTKTRNSNGQAVDCDLNIYAYTGSQAVDSVATFYVTPDRKIQAAIDTAWDGETVKLAAGTYIENVLLNKPLTIAGVGHEDNPASNTIIQAENGKKTKPIIDITSGNTVVKNLQVKGANENAGIDDRGTGIKIGGSTDISQVILENIASNENWFGLNIAPDHSCISDVNANGIKISNSVGSGVNTLTMHGSITDVHLDGAKISGSGVNGINAAIGYESSISGLSLDGAQISNSGGNGIYAYAVSGSSISNVNLADTTISESGLTGVVVREYSDSTIWNINLKGAMITGSGKSGTDEIDKCGIFFYSADGGPISNVNLDSATISRSKGDGVYAGTHGSGSISDVRMNGGKITSNGGYGLFANGDVSFVVFNKDNIYGNNEGGVYNQCSHTIDARANWWGAPNGPSGGVTDPITGISANGAGDSVSINVWFDPWSQWLFP